MRKAECRVPCDLFSDRDTWLYMVEVHVGYKVLLYIVPYSYIVKEHPECLAAKTNSVAG